MRGRRRAKLWLWHCLFLGGAWERESGRDPGLCAPVIWEMRKMRRRDGGAAAALSAAGEGMGRGKESDRMVFLSE